MSFLDARDHGSKVGSGGHSSAQTEAIDRRERLRRLTLETINLLKDPYFMRKRQLCLLLQQNGLKREPLPLGQSLHLT